MIFNTFENRFGNRPLIRRHRHSRPDWRQPVNEAQKKAFKEDLQYRVEHWRIIMGETPVRWTIRNMKSQWGNCRPQTRQLTFNMQLALLDNSLRDYIIVHELSHLQVPNHGPQFKARMDMFLPDWRTRRKLLREYVIHILNP